LKLISDAFHLKCFPDDIFLYFDKNFNKQENPPFHPKKELEWMS